MSRRLTVRDVARRTGKSQKTIYRYIWSGKLQAELVTTPQGQLYLIDEQQVTDAGLALVHGAQPTGVSDPREEPARPASDALLGYLQKQLAELKNENDALKRDHERALYVIGVYRGRLEQLRRRLLSFRRGRVDSERELLRARNDAEFYRHRLQEDKDDSLLGRILRF